MIFARFGAVVFLKFSVSQSVRHAYSLCERAIHCERCCASENVSVRDLPVSEKM